MVFLHLSVYLYSIGQWVVSVSRRSMCANMICRRVLTFIRFHTNQNVYKIAFVYHTGALCRCFYIERARSTPMCVDFRFGILSFCFEQHNQCVHHVAQLVPKFGTRRHLYSNPGDNITSALRKKNCLRNTFECLILLRLSIHCLQTAI